MPDTRCDPYQVETALVSTLERKKYAMHVTRRSFLTSLAATHLLFSKTARAFDSGRPLVGAIRWDAWYAPGSGPTSAVEKSLGPPQYRWRFPFFAEVKAEAATPIQLPKGSQALMDLEIRQATYAGLDYWAFVGYEPNNPMSAGLTLYLNSQENHAIKFCFFTELVRFGDSKQFSELVDEHIKLMSHPNYVRTPDGRPLYYLGFIDNRTVNSRWGSVEGLRRGILGFRRKTFAAVGKDPYIAICGPFAEFREWSSTGGDAISAYSIGDPRAIGAYSALANIVEERWVSFTSAGLPVIPTAMAGLDRRPRVEHPVPWEPYQKPGEGIAYHYESSNPEELARHVERALGFAVKQSAPAVLIYAWNENDEGGWLVPTLPCETKRIVSLHRVLTPNGQVPNPGCKFD